MGMMVLWTVMIIGLLGDVPGSATVERPRQKSLEDFRPHWQVGDQWVIETRTRAVQTAGFRADWLSRPVRWRFVVREAAKLAGTDCFRVEVYSMDAGPGDWVASFWVQQNSFSLREFQGRVLVGGQVRTITESYAFPAGQPSPVDTPFPVLGVALPCFWADRMKGVQKFTYETTAGPAGRKAPGEVAFLVQAEQEVLDPPSEFVRRLPYADWQKDLDAPTVEVRIRTPSSLLRQFWQAGQPWPIYWENSTTRSRLVEVQRASSRKPKEATQ